MSERLKESVFARELLSKVLVTAIADWENDSVKSVHDRARRTRRRLLRYIAMLEQAVPGHLGGEDAK